MLLFGTEEKDVLKLPQCHLCGLYRKCNSPKMKPSGSGKRRILFVGEAPGETEDEIGKQFVGKSGDLLRESVAKLGTSLDQCIVTNSIICRPPKNVMDKRYHEYCRPVLVGLLNERRADVVVALGDWALKQIIPEGYARYGAGVSMWRGWRIPLHKFGVWLCPTFHPSYLLRSGEDPFLLKMFENDLAAAFRRVGKPLTAPTIEDLKTRVELVTDASDARHRLKWLTKQEGTLAFDYETTGLKPEARKHQIVSCGFCLNGEKTWACLMSDDLLPLLSQVLSSKRLRKIASNLKFEERWTLKIFKHRVANWYWDTMLAAHCLDNRTGISSLKFQSFVRFGVGGWEDEVEPYLKSQAPNGFNKIRNCPTKTLLLYNGLDALLEHLVMEEQRREMGCDC